MQFTLTSLKGHKRASKTVKADGSTESYPLIKNFTSAEIEVDVSQDLSEFEDAIRRVSNDGACLLKGGLDAPLKKESRAGRTNKDESTRWVVVDIDGYKMPGADMSFPITEAKLQRMSEAIIKELPPCFQNTSYVAQASSSLGTKGDRVSMHLYFALKTPVDPLMLKRYIRHLNMTLPAFCSTTRLTASGHALQFQLDPTVAINTKLIYVAPPVYKNSVHDPFADPKDRITTVNYPDHLLDLSKDPNIHEDGAQTSKLVRARIKVLRDDAGLPDTKMKLVSFIHDGTPSHYIANPQHIAVQVVDAELPYVRCNVNNGDSGAYYVDIRAPKLMRNFKDEQFFDLSVANPTVYHQIIEQFGGDAEKHRTGTRPIVFRDQVTDKHYAGLFDSDANAFDEGYPLSAIGLMNVKDMMLSYGEAPPEVVPQGDLFFDPTSNEPKINVDRAPYYVNTYAPPKIHASPPMFAELDIDTFAKMQVRCPNIYRLLDHVCGNDPESMGRFLNWLSHIHQTRTKTGTAWVFSGTQGTGKGVLMYKVIRPIFGDAYAPVETLQSLDEKYNETLEPAIICNVDEFRMKDSKGKNTLANTLKNAITEPTIKIRKMHNAGVEKPNYTNFIFFSNSRDAIQLEAGDRRYNVATPQETPILDVWPSAFAPDALFGPEIAAFSGMLHHFKVDKLLVTKPMVNEAKKDMMAASRDFFDEFCEAVREGDLQFFQPILDISLNDSSTASKVIDAQNIVRRWARDVADGERLLIGKEEMRTLYNTMSEKNFDIQQREFGKKTDGFGLKVGRYNDRNGKPRRSFIMDPKKDHTTLAKEIVDNNLTYIKNAVSN